MNTSNITLTLTAFTLLSEGICMFKNEMKEIEVKSGGDQYIERPTLPAIIKDDSKKTFVSDYTIHIAEHLIDNESVCKSNCGSIATHLKDEMEKYLTWEAAKCSFYNPDYFGFHTYTHENSQNYAHLLTEIEAKINEFLIGKKSKDTDIACIVACVQNHAYGKFQQFIAIPNQAKNIRLANLWKNKNLNAYRKKVHKICKETGEISGWTLGITTGISGAVLTLPSGGVGAALGPMAYIIARGIFGRGLECILTGGKPVHKGEFKD